MQASEPLVRWLLTYLLHSSLLLGAAGLVSAILKERWLGVQEAVLRAALVGGLVTATLQVTLDLRPLGGALPLPSVRLETQPQLLAPAPAPSRAASVTVRTLALTTAVTRPPLPSAARPGTRATRPQRPSLARPTFNDLWRPLILGLWATLAVWGLTRLGVAALRLRALLGDRRPLRDLTLLPLATGLAETLGLRRPPRLSTTARLTVPLATGLWRPEVCLPTRVLSDLAPDEQLALCAHELAHVVRRDPVWLLVTRLVEALLPVQPLNLWARRRLQDIAECLSDDLAVASSARRLGLARSLVDVACWTTAAQSLVPLTAPGAFGARSRLALRVERLMDPLRRLERPRRLLLPVAAAAVLATALITPVVSGQGAAATPRPRPAPKPQPVVTSAQPAPAVAARPLPPPPPPPAPPAPPAALAPTPLAAPPPPPPDEGLELERAELEQRLAELTRRIEQRAQNHEAEQTALAAELTTLTERLAPNKKELERLQAEIAKTAEALAKEHLATARRLEQEALRSAKAQTKQLAEQRAQMERELRHALGKVRPSDDQLHALSEKARALAEQARPTDAEMQELRRLTRELAHSVAREIEPEAREAAHLAREAAEQAREALRQTRDELQRVREEAQREAAETAAAAARAARP